MQPGGKRGGAGREAGRAATGPPPNGSRRPAEAPSTPRGAAGPATPPAGEKPASFRPPVAATIDWLRQTFASYYGAHPLRPPDRFTRREFGFILWPDRPGPPPFVRHRAYRRTEEMQAFLARRGPHSAYYSTAYYRRPGELRMDDKQWLGAELIFDLDADHLQEVEAAKASGSELPLDEQLRLVKKQFIRLLDEFLLGDFGFAAEDLFITFSGGRGYHAHVTSHAVLSLGSRERREIVDYVTGKVPADRDGEPDLSRFVWEETVAMRGEGRFMKPLVRLRTHPASTPGWPGRMTRTLVETLQKNVLQATRDDAHAWLTALKGVGKGGADRFIDRFTAEHLSRIEQGILDQGPIIRRVCHHVLEQATIPMARGETDEPVTADVKRLIRLPGSLHGKTGLRVVTLERDGLEAFDPLRDAVAFPDGAVEMTPRFDQELSLAGQRVRVEAGQTVEVPTGHAVFWCARQAGTVATKR